MPTYALLGATGATGSAVLRCLLSEPPANLQLNILVRSKAKLQKAFPQLQEIESISATITEGNATNEVAMAKCLHGADAVFMCVAQNESALGVSLTYDTVSTIIAALKRRRKTQGSAYKRPSILQLRSASLNPDLSCQVPRVVYNIVSFCLHYNHVDVVRACELYESAAAKGLLSWIYVDPPTVHDAFGTQPTGYKLISTEKQETALSYADLGASFCELARRRDEFRNRPVGVTATGKVKESWGVLAGYLLDGAVGRVKGGLAEKSFLTKIGLGCCIVVRSQALQTCRVFSDLRQVLLFVLWLSV